MIDQRRAPGSETTMLRVGEAARLLHVHPNTLRKWSTDGLIPSYRIGRRRDRRFALEDLARFLASGSVGSEN
jgi:excisionase family DNA binding protein